MTTSDFAISAIGYVRSTLKALDDAPRQGDEGAPEAWLEINESALPALTGMAVGDDIIVLTWLHQADRHVLKVHPRGDTTIPLSGVFVTRSPDRPNPIGLHTVRVLEIVSGKLRVAPLEAIDGTPIVDLKPVLLAIRER